MVALNKNNTSYKLVTKLYPSVSVTAKVSTICGIGIGEYLRIGIGIGGIVGIGAPLLNIAKLPSVEQNVSWFCHSPENLAYAELNC